MDVWLPPSLPFWNSLFYAGFFQTPVLKTVVIFVESALSFVKGSASILSVGIHVTLSTFWLCRWSFILSTCSRIDPSSTCFVDRMDSTNDAESVKHWMGAGFS